MMKLGRAPSTGVSLRHLKKTSAFTRKQFGAFVPATYLALPLLCFLHTIRIGPHCTVNLYQAVASRNQMPSLAVPSEGKDRAGKLHHLKREAGMLSVSLRCLFVLNSPQMLSIPHVSCFSWKRRKRNEAINYVCKTSQLCKTKNQFINLCRFLGEFASKIGRTGCTFPLRPQMREIIKHQSASTKPSIDPFVDFFTD